ncbi:phasin family protein [Pikeienuella piscinae]|uniref:Phasin family protein n=1 Tax=Pikeienuella piscinae TaxID=2748098 RepID=A0A7L5BTQ0_9RHOB|nr:phasin family protein [Pikeienuella piscinae]QIE55490.1 phasin family protein [Pikeienuella piscinae]
MATAKDAAAKVETLAADAQKAATDQFEKISKSLEDVAAFGQDNMDALMKSSSVAVKAAEELNAEIMSFSKKSVEEAVASAKEMSSIKTVPEFVEKQAAFAKTSLDGYMKQAAKINEMFMAAAKDMAEPMNARAAAAADMVKSYRL